MHQQISKDYLVAKQHNLDDDRNELRAFINSPEFSQLETTQQGFIVSQVGLMATLSEIMSVRLGAPAKLTIAPNDLVLVKADHASDVLYPAIKSAMAELNKLPLAFYAEEINTAYNTLWDAFWSETPAPRDVPQRR